MTHEPSLDKCRLFAFSACFKISMPVFDFLMFMHLSIPASLRLGSKRKICPEFKLLHTTCCRWPRLFTHLRNSNCSTQAAADGLEITKKQDGVEQPCFSNMRPWREFAQARNSVACINHTAEASRVSLSGNRGFCS